MAMMLQTVKIAAQHISLLTMASLTAPMGAKHPAPELGLLSSLCKTVATLCHHLTHALVETHHLKVSKCEISMHECESY